METFNAFSILSRSTSAVRVYIHTYFHTYFYNEAFEMLQIPNLLGFVLGLLQLMLFWIYPSKSLTSSKPVVKGSTLTIDNI